jgi:hypothetical protein
MKKLSVLAVAGLGAMTIAQPALSLEMTGGDIALGYSAFSEKVEGETLSQTSIEGSLELGFTKEFGAQVDFGVQQFEQLNNLGADNATNVTLHGLYHMNETATFGAFYGRDSLEDLDLDFYGLEAGFEGSGFDVEAYFGTGELDGVDGKGNVFGVSGAYELTSSFELIGSFAKASFDGDVDVSTFEAGVAYNFTNSVQIAATLGRLSGEVEGLGSESEDYFGLEAEYSFGAARGATFGERGLIHLIPGL